MKKLTALLLSLAMVFSLAACGNTANTPADTSKDDAQTPAGSPVEKPDDTNTPDDAETPDDANAPADTTAEQPQTGKTLVVYYSASGNTARVWPRTSLPPRAQTSLRSSPRRYIPATT